MCPIRIKLMNHIFIGVTSYVEKVNIVSFIPVSTLVSKAYQILRFITHCTHDFFISPMQYFIRPYLEYVAPLL